MEQESAVTQADSLIGVLEIEDINFFIDPLQKKLFNTEHIDKALILGAAILAGIMLLWAIDKVLTWAVNNNTDTDKRKNRVPFFLFPAFFFAAFIIDYITIIFGKFQYPWLSFSVLVIKGTYFLSTSFWAMGVFNIPIAKMFSFLTSVFKAWRTKDVDELNKSIENLSKQDSKPNIGKKMVILILVFIIISCIAPKKIITADPIRRATTELRVDTSTLQPGQVKRFYKGAFDSNYLVKKSKENQSANDSKAVYFKKDTIVFPGVMKIEQAADSRQVLLTDIPVYYRGLRVGTFKVSNKES